MKAWRGERVHAQVVVRSDRPTGLMRLANIRLDRVSSGSAPIELTPRPVKEIEGVSDLLDDPETAEIGTNLFLAVWVTADVPRNADPGLYRGRFTIAAKGGNQVDFPVELEVLPATLPEKNTFYLDLWQNVCAVARYHRVKPYSKEHYAVLEPLLKELAAAGQKAVTVPICAYPWGKGYLHDEFIPVVTDVRYRDGRCEPDFRLFDEFVEFARGCGIGPQIHCYTILKFAHRFEYWYIEGETGEERKVTLNPDTPEWKAFWRPFLAKFEAHVREKGWLEDVFIAVDEGDPKDQFTTRAFLKETVPSLKYACAANKDGRLFKGLEADVYSQIIWRDYCPGEFLDTIAERRAKGWITTFYVCTEPQKPNTWFKSPLIESHWIGLYAAAKRFDGFLRWAVFHWPDDPFVKVSANSFPSGEEILLYPGAKASLRWEILRDSIEDWRKIESLRAADGSLPAKLAAALDAIDFEAAKTDGENTYRDKIGAVLKALDEVAGCRQSCSPVK